MLNIGPGELVAVLVIALIVLGPEKLPEMLRTVGRVTSELRRISSGFQTELQNALDEDTDREVRTVKRTPRTAARGRNGADDAATTDEPEAAPRARPPHPSADSPPDDAGGEAAG